MNILITGGASGLGEAITQELSKAKENNILFTYNNSLNEAKNLCSKYSNLKMIKCDFREENDITDLLDYMSSFNINVLINNAQITKIEKKHFHKLDYTIFKNNFIKNIIPTIRITQKAIENFRKIKFGKIITILTSSLINKPPIGYAEYVACKSYLLSLSKSWANENARFNITSNCISPSFMETSLTSDTDERVIEEIISHHPLKKLLKSNEVAEVVAFLVNSSQQINGINLIINSGENIF